jgi:hypothetical protein
MLLSREICNLQIRRNKRQSNDVMFGMITNKMTIDLNMLSSFMKKRATNNLNRTMVVTIHRNELRKGNSYICK